MRVHKVTKTEICVAAAVDIKTTVCNNVATL